MQEHQLANNKLTYGCEICGAHYARAFALRDHRKEQHSIEEIGDNMAVAHRTETTSEVHEDSFVSNVPSGVVEDVMF